MHCIDDLISYTQLLLCNYWGNGKLFILLILGACARVTVVVLCVCVSVTKLTATYLVYESKMWFCTVPSSVPNACIMWISLKTPCFPALASFADAKLLDFRHSTFYLYIKSYTNGAYVIVISRARGMYGIYCTEARGPCAQGLRAINAMHPECAWYNLFISRGHSYHA